MKKPVNFNCFFFSPTSNLISVIVPRNSINAQRRFRFVGVVLCVLAGLLSQPTFGQKTISLDDFSSFQDPGKTWKIVGNVTADLQQANQLHTTKGKGILVNLPDANNHGKDLYTNFEHSDMDLELDYMMAKGSNSGIYLQGRYELQLLDSWGVNTPTSGDNGGIYERWDESRPEGQQGYQGYAPRQNVSRAPGLWQHLKVSFQAPRFDEQGNKIENARILRVELNGVTIHEDVELLGPTRGAMSPEEKNSGPLRFQGDHGAVAFRNIKVTHYDKPRPELTDIHYSVYAGRFEAEPDFSQLPPEAEGSSVILTSDLSPKSQQFLIKYTGTLNVKEAGEYSFNMQFPGGSGLLRINKQEVIPISGWSGQGQVTLPKGKMPFEMLYSKHVDWVEPALGLAVAGPGIREYLITNENDIRSGNPVDPILVASTDKKILRSFMDLPVPENEEGGIRVVHAVSVSSPNQLHYTYDMDKGNWVQIWRGGFLDATPMWHDRGDGSSRPTGSVLHFGKPALALAKLSSNRAAWATDTTGSGYIPKGYTVDQNDAPTFRYQIYGAQVEDAIRVLENGQGFQRKIAITKPVEALYVRLAVGDKIESLSDQMYLIDDKSYFLRIEDSETSPVVRDVKGKKELIVPVKETLTYSILF